MADNSKILTKTMLSHAANLAGYLERGVNPILDMNDKENHHENDWQRQHYFDVGSDALSICVKALVSHNRMQPETILDFPCGSGRVMRHLRAMFPNARIAGNDLYKTHVQFCVDNFGAEAFHSKENLDELHVKPEWDLIFCGSLLTHLPEKLVISAVNFMRRALSPNGIAVFTTEGRPTEYIQDNKWKLIKQELFDVAREKFHKTGFGFVSYEHDFKQSFPDQELYGVTLIKPSWMLSQLEKMQDIRVLSVSEGMWDDHQDVYVIGRPGIDDEPQPNFSAQNAFLP